MHYCGTVVAFDSQRGLGMVQTETDQYGVPVLDVYPFHCVSIADGTRTIPVGTPVWFGLRNGRNGQLEADGLLARSLS